MSLDSQGGRLNGNPSYAYFLYHRVGMAVAERTNLFRVQALRGVGGNGWRMSHNPYQGTLYDTMDRLGVLIWDETRDFKGPELPAFGRMVQEHRNHPSVMTWSFCNEGGCNAGENHTLAAEFRKMAYEWDGTRPVTGNMRGSYGNGTLSDMIDVQGLSHPLGSVMDQVHAETQGKALIASECCSCMTMRGEMYTNVSEEHPVPSNFNADCLSEQVNRSDDGRPWSVGSMIWTLFGYYGEPYHHAWPHTASSYGSFDLAGFPKAAVWWHRSLWLSGVAQSDPGRPPLPSSPTIRIVQDNEADSRAPMSNGSLSNIIQVYTSCAMAELFVNGIGLGKQVVPRYMWAEWTFPYTAGNLTALGCMRSGERCAVHTVMTAAKPTGVLLSIDVPSPRTGTGDRLVLDGHDTALLRAEIVDWAGRRVPLAANNITFEVLSGPGCVVAVGNGDPTNHQPNQVRWRSAFHGLNRAIVRVTIDAASNDVDRNMLLEVDVDGGRANPNVTIIPGGATPPSAPIVVRASSPGLDASTVSIPISADAEAYGVLAVATRSHRLAYIGE